ncbi:MAG: hypothetical protein ACE5F9_07745 [Phycisphaerae bacterium]
MSLRNGRRWLTARATSAGLSLAPRLAPRAIDGIERWLARAGPRLPILAQQVAANMRAAGVYSESGFRAYFQQTAQHLSNGLRVFRAHSAGEAITKLVDAEIRLDGSISHLRHALAAGRGAVVAAPHVCNYLLTLERLSREVPLRIYLRWSADARKRELKQAWCRAAGLSVLLEPASASDPSSRAAAIVDILREGLAVVITPDIAQASDKGVPVRLFNRQVFLPTGPASIAGLAGAPLVPVFGRVEGRVHTIMCDEPIEIESLRRADGGRPAALRRTMQRWADPFQRFLNDTPEAWFLWGDSRWTRVFHGDPRYAAPIEPTSPNDATARLPRIKGTT